MFSGMARALVVAWVAAIAAWGCGGAKPETREGGADTAATAGGEGQGGAPAGNAQQELAAIEAYVAAGMAHVRTRRCDLAITQGFDPALAAFERNRPGPGVRVVASRSAGSPAQALLALFEASQQNPQGSTVLTDATWPDTMYMKAFCLVDLGRVDEAEVWLRRALELIPNDVVYSCELGHIQQQRRNWDASLAIYQGALDNVTALEASLPPDATFFGLSISDWTRRSLRGIGYTLIEMGRYDEAIQIYHRVLAIDPNDERAQQELQYINQRRAGTI